MQDINSRVRGFSIPFRIESGCVADAAGSEKLKENIVHILLTGVGERVMRREYGGGVRQLVHDPNDDVMRALVQHQIAKSIAQWEPRVSLQDISITRQEVKGDLLMDITYVIRRTQQIETLTVPIPS